MSSFFGISSQRKGIVVGKEKVGCRCLSHSRVRICIISDALPSVPLVNVTYHANSENM